MLWVAMAFEWLLFEVLWDVDKGSQVMVDELKAHALAVNPLYWLAILAFLTLIASMGGGFVGSIGLLLSLVLIVLVTFAVGPYVERFLGWAWPVIKWVLILGAVVASTGAFGAERGIASVYSSRESHGAPACSKVARVMDDRALVAAHKALPCGAKVKVTNTKTGASVVVMIIDRGPFVPGRVIDLSPAAAGALGFKGLAPVTLEVVS